MSPAATMSVDDATTAVLDAADALFYSRGVQPVAMAEVRDRAGVSLRRLYSLFGSKDDLIAQWLAARHDAWTAGFRAEVDRALASGAEPVDAVFDALEVWMRATDYRGCGFINTHAERGDLRSEHRAIIRAHKKELADQLERLVPNGRAIAVLFDGAIVQASIFAEPGPIHRAREAARVLAGEGARG